MLMYNKINQWWAKQSSPIFCFFYEGNLYLGHSWVQYILTIECIFTLIYTKLVNSIYNTFIDGFKWAIES